MYLFEPFGTKEFFTNYIHNQLEKEGYSHEVIHRIHFAMTQYTFETFGLKDGMVFVKNLTEVCEKFSNQLVKEI